jgi:hypothetical protein
MSQKHTSRVPVRTKQERLDKPGYSQVENLWRKQLTRLVSHDVSSVSSSSGTTKPFSNSIAINHRNVRQITRMIVEKELMPNFPDKRAIMNLCGDVSQTSPELFNKLRQHSHQCHSNTAAVLRKWLENGDFWEIFIIEFEYSVRTYSRWSQPYYDYEYEDKVRLYRNKIKNDPHVFEWLWHLTHKFISRQSRRMEDRMEEPFFRLRDSHLAHFKAFLDWTNQQYLTELPSTEPVKFVCITKLLNTVFQTVSQMSGFDSIACMKYFSGIWMHTATINPNIFRRVSFVFHPRLLRQLLSWSGLMRILTHRFTGRLWHFWNIIIRKVIGIAGIAPLNRCLHRSPIISVY